jgi:hypothetical protein
MHPQPNVVAFNPDVGEPILRRRYTGRSSLENFDLILTKAQTDRLFEFWNTDCAQGALHSGPGSLMAFSANGGSILTRRRVPRISAAGLPTGCPSRSGADAKP